jgi:acetamidase/formamidase
MQRIPRAQAMEYAFSGKVPPKLRVQEGESFILETEDAGSGVVRSADVLPTPQHRPQLRHTPGWVNPNAGPVYVEGCAAGDVLAVTIEDIVPDSQGFTTLHAHARFWPEPAKWAEVARPYTHIIKHLPGPDGTTRTGTAVFNERFRWDLKPFIGCIAVAPEWEVEGCGYGQGPWGGNLDIRDVCVGNTILLPTFHDGGLLYIGDVHGSQADTEFTGTANETRAEVRVSCKVIKGKRIPWMRIDKPESIVSIAVAKPLEDAVERAVFGLCDWLVEDYGVNRRDAYLFMSVHPAMRINVYQMVPLGRLQYVAGAEFQKAALR